MGIWRILRDKEDRNPEVPRPSAYQRLASFPREVAPDGEPGDLVAGFLNSTHYLLLFGPTALKRYGDHVARRIGPGLGDVFQPLQDVLEVFEGRDVLLRRSVYVDVDVRHGSISSR